MERSTPDWRDLAACRSVSREMVPDEDDAAGVQLAKKVCADCPVRTACLLAAQRDAAELGDELVQGVWGGLTGQERATMAGLGRWPAPCSRCGLDCVPVTLATDECGVCNPGARVLLGDYRPQIMALIDEGWTYEQIADHLHLLKVSVSGACHRWKVPSKKRSRGKRRGNLPCGTEAAKYRHHRRQKQTGNPEDGFRNCPVCRDVPWKNRKSPQRSKS